MPLIKCKNCGALFPQATQDAKCTICGGEFTGIISNKKTINTSLFSSKLIEKRLKRNGNDVIDFDIPSIYNFNGEMYKILHIGNHIFENCVFLQNITIPNSVISIGHYAFSGCSSLKNLTIPNSVTKIGESAFSYCSSLINLTIPDSVTQIGYMAFRGISRIYYNGTATGSPWGADEVSKDEISKNKKKSFFDILFG